jgi:hypothetical protein
VRSSFYIPRFNIINENEFTILVKDDDVTSDDFVGKGDGTLAKVCRFELVYGSESGHQCCDLRCPGGEIR